MIVTTLKARLENYVAFTTSLSGTVVANVKEVSSP